MKNLITRTLTSLMLAVVGLGTVASAELAPVIKVSIPFEFNFGDQTFPAGDYTLVQPQQHVLVLRDARGHLVAQRLTGGVESTNASDVTKLRFKTVDGQHILAEVWEQGDASGLRVYPPKSRNDVARNRSTESRDRAEGSQP